MRCIRQRPEWPRFTWDEAEIAPLEADFRLAAERSLGAAWHLDDEERRELRVEFLTDEAVDTSAIEGEILDRDSVQSSIREHFGWKGRQRRPTPEETGAADLMVALYSDFDRSLVLAMLCDWHRRLLRGRSDLPEIGAFRRSDRPMQVVSGPAAVVHYEAPPSARVPAEMGRFVRWYEGSAAEGFPPLTRAGVAHLDFVFVHPFEDGNGRIARALAEKALARALGRPSLIALSREIARRRRAYYQVLERANRSFDLTRWLRWFAETAVAAQRWSERRVVCSVEQARMFRRLGDRLNPRQAKVLRRLFRAEPEGFEGGLSAGKYRRITGATPATATRDLAGLVTLGALHRSGAGRYTRYRLALALPPDEASLRTPAGW